MMSCRLDDFGVRRHREVDTDAFVLGNLKEILHHLGGLGFVPVAHEFPRYFFDRIHLVPFHLIVAPRRVLSLGHGHRVETRPQRKRRDRSVRCRSGFHESHRLAGHCALEAISHAWRKDPLADEPVDSAAGERHRFVMDLASGGCAAKNSNTCCSEAVPQQLAHYLVARRSVGDTDVGGKAKKRGRYAS